MWRMWWGLAIFTAAMLLALVGCSDGGDDAGTLETRLATTIGEVDWLKQFEPFTSVEVIDGYTVGVKEDEGNIYVQDCAALDTLIAEGARFGPSERDPETLEYEPGYGGICDRRPG